MMEETFGEAKSESDATSLPALKEEIEKGIEMAEEYKTISVVTLKERDSPLHDYIKEGKSIKDISEIGDILDDSEDLEDGHKIPLIP